MAIISPLSTTNTDINITSGTGSISIGADLVQKAVTIGNYANASSLTLNAGSGGITLVTSGGVLVYGLTASGAAIFNSSGYILNAESETAGFVLTSNGPGGTPSFQAAAGATWVNVSSTPQAMTAGVGYIAARTGSPVTELTLPTTAAVGTLLYIQGYGSAGWSITQAAGQSINIGSSSSTVGATGSVSSANQYDSVVLVCVVADLTWCCIGAPQSAGLVIV